MKKIILAIATASTLMLGACNKSPSDKLAGRVESAADHRADTLKNQADALKAQAASLDHQADAVKDNGKARADAIKAADQNVANMTQAQRDAIVANQAAAVR